MEEEGSVQQGTQIAEKVTGYMNLLQTLDGEYVQNQFLTLRLQLSN